MIDHQLTEVLEYNYKYHTREKNKEVIPEENKRDSQFLKDAYQRLQDMLSGKYYFDKQEEANAKKKLEE